MPRKFLKRLLPDPHSFRTRRELRFLGKLLDDPFLLHLNRRSVAGACALGLFVAFIPVPGQMLIAAALAILIRVNLVLSAVTVWITNPITMPPIFYFCYRLGARVLGEHARSVPFEPSLQWFWQELAVIWQPLLLGCLLLGAAAALLGYVSVQLLWRLHVVQALRSRRLRRERGRS
jgi:uncharacterized protein (DUF2062 family)